MSLSTGDRTFRDDLPRLLTDAHESAFSGGGDEIAVLKFRMIFLERLLQVLVGVMAADSAGLGLPWPPQFRDLLKKLEKPSTGDWASAAWALSKGLIGEPRRIAFGYPTLLARPDQKATDSFLAIEVLLKLRNNDAHNRERAIRMVAESEAPFRTLLAAARCLGKHHFHAILKKTALPKGMEEVQIVRLCGGDRERSTKEVPAGIPLQVPFMVGEQGDVLKLMPFLALTSFASSGIPDVLVLTRVTGAGPDWRGASVDAEDPSNAHQLRNQADVEKWLHPSLRLPALLNPRDLAHPSLENPRQIGPYTIEAPIGSGATGRVFRAKGANGTVAIKILDPLVARDDALRSRLKREFRLMKQLQSPHVARVYDCEEDPVVGLYLAMEYIEGGDLGRIGPPSTPDQALKWMVQLLSGLEQLHAQGIIHRDLKPGNILLRGDRSLVLVDLGIALQPDATRSTRKGEVLGTTAWAAPEQLLGSNVGPSADVYAAGRLLGWLYSGSVDPKEQSARLPHKLRSVWRQATQVTPALRFPQAREFLKALRASESLDCMLMPGEFFGQDWRTILCMNSKYSDLALVHAERMQMSGKRWFIGVLPGPRRTEVLNLLRNFSGEERKQRGLGDPFDLADGTLLIPTDGRDGEHALWALLGASKTPVAPPQNVVPPPTAAGSAKAAPPPTTTKAPAGKGSDIVVAAAGLGALALGVLGAAALGNTVANNLNAQKAKKVKEGGGGARGGG